MPCAAAYFACKFELRHAAHHGLALKITRDTHTNGHQRGTKWTPNGNLSVLATYPFSPAPGRNPGPGPGARAAREVAIQRSRELMSSSYFAGSLFKLNCIFITLIDFIVN